nr:hypothetical protein [Tanacetum cinerariifolium]
MLDSCTVTTCIQSCGRMDYARVLVDIRADRALKDTMVISIMNPIGNGCPKRVLADLSSMEERLMMVSKLSKGSVFVVLVLANRGRKVVEEAKHRNTSSKNGQWISIVF